MLIINELRCLGLVNIKLSITLLSVCMTAYGPTYYGDFPLHELLAFYLRLTGFSSNPPEVNLNFCCLAHPEQDEGWWVLLPFSCSTEPFYQENLVLWDIYNGPVCSQGKVPAYIFPLFHSSQYSPLYFPPNTLHTYTQTCAHAHIHCSETKDKVLHACLLSDYCTLCLSPSVS